MPGGAYAAADDDDDDDDDDVVYCTLHRRVRSCVQIHYGHIL